MAGEKRQITRNRISYSCQKCRQRKVKCDKTHPICGACQKTGEECIYATIDVELQSGNDAQTVSAPQRKKRRQSPRSSHHESTGDDENSRNGQNLEVQLGQLSGLLDRLGSIIGAAPNQQHGRTQSPKTNRLSQRHSPWNSLYLGNGSTSSTSQKDQDDQIGSSAAPRDEGQHQKSPDFKTISARLEDLMILLRLQEPIATADKSSSLASAGQFPMSIAPSGSNPELSLQLPSDTQRNALFRCWLSSVYPMLPIVDPSTVLVYYRAFHFWYTYGFEKGIPNPCEDKVPIIYAVYYAGMVSMSQKGVRKWFPGAPRHEMLRRMRQQFEQILNTPVRFVDNPFTLAARTMMAYLSCQDSKVLGLTNALPKLLKMAYACTLHRERPNKTLDPSLAELRRRLWWEMVQLDIHEATAHNTPLLINDHYCDVDIPTEVRDSKLGTPEAEKFLSELREGKHAGIVNNHNSNNQQFSILSVIYLVTKARTVLASNSRKLININLAARPKTQEDMTEIRRILDECSHQVSIMIDRIPARGIPELNFLPAQNNSTNPLTPDNENLYGDDLISSEIDCICGDPIETEPWETPYISQHRTSITAFHKWARIALSMCIDQFYCFSYAPFLSNTKTKLWVSARQCVLRHSHSYLRKFHTLAADIEFERFRWTWSKLFQPVHACIIILLDTYERPNSKEAARARELLDQMLSLALPAPGIISGEDGLTTIHPLQQSGNEAYTMLMQLRAKAWLKAGLDPSVLWTEQDQIDIGATQPPSESDRMERSFREDIVWRDTHNQPHPPPPSEHPLLPSLRERASEKLHPSEAGIPDDSQPISLPTEPTPIHTEDRQQRPRLRHARPNQQLAPTIHAPGPTPRKEGHVYTFKPPSELYDIDELVRRIRSAQNQKTSQDSGEDIVSTAQDLNRILAAQKTVVPGQRRQDSVADRQDGGTGLLNQGILREFLSNDRERERERERERDNSTTAMNKGLASVFTSLDNHLVMPNQPSSNISGHTTKTISDTRANHAVETNTAREVTDPISSAVVNTDQAEGGERGAEANTVEMMNIEFDWAKWDEVFSHILDDGFGDAVMLDQDQDQGHD